MITKGKGGRDPNVGAIKETDRLYFWGKKRQRVEGTKGQGGLVWWN